MRVEAQEVSLNLAGIRIVERATLTARNGSMVGIIGPNGSGKTTLITALYRALAPAEGRVVVGGHDVWSDLSARQSAQRTAVVLQDGFPEFAFTVREIVETGRVPHQRPFQRATAEDDEAVSAALETTGMTAFSDRLVGTLSGGERQRVFVARALAQRTPVMVLDEPTNHLDIAAQVDLLELLRSLPSTVITALHDLNLAATYCDELYVMAAGRVIAHGPVAEVLTPATIARVYGVHAHCGTNPLTGRLAITFGHRTGTPDNASRKQSTAHDDTKTTPDFRLPHPDRGDGYRPRGLRLRE